MILIFVCPRYKILIPGDPQIKAQDSHKLPCGLSHWFWNPPENCLKRQPLCNAEELQICIEGGSWFRVGRLRWSSRATNLPQKIPCLSGLVFQQRWQRNCIFASLQCILKSFWVGNATDGRCHQQVWHCQCVWDCDVPGHRFTVLPRDQHASVYTLITAIKCKSPNIMETSFYSIWLGTY